MFAVFPVLAPAPAVRSCSVASNVLHALPATTAARTLSKNAVPRSTGLLMYAMDAAKAMPGALFLTNTATMRSLQTESTAKT